MREERGGQDRGYAKTRGKMRSAGDHQETGGDEENKKKNHSSSSHVTDYEQGPGTSSRGAQASGYHRSTFSL